MRLTCPEGIAKGVASAVDILCPAQHICIIEGKIKMPETIKQVVVRSWGSATSSEAIIVTAEVTDDFSSTLKDAIVAAVNKWCETTDEGEAAWLESRFDFNVGDLLNYTPFDGVLAEALNAQGIINLELELADCYEDWEFDDVLIQGETQDVD